jgi:hypothetical protein
VKSYREAVMSEHSIISTYEHVFGPETTTAMGNALEQICAVLGLGHDAIAREVIASRIIELTRRGERDATKLRDRILMEANGAAGSWGSKS